MSVREYGSRSIKWRLGGLGYGPFIGGLNYRDSYTEVAPNELTDATNYTLDERGILTKRNDCPTTASLAGASTPPGAVTAFFYSVSLNLFIVQSGTQLYKAAPGAGSWTSFRTNSSSDVCRFCDFGAKLVFAHQDDGVFTYDGTTVTAGTAIAGITFLVPWQNKVWAGTGEAATASQRSRVYFSNAGVPGTFTTASDFVDIREKDDKPLLAAIGGSGLVVFKEDSAYRVNDSTTGSYQTIDWTTGCVGWRAVTAQDGRIFTWSVDGLYEGDGLGRFVNVGDKLRPRFLSTTVNTTTKALISATNLNGRVYFAYPRSSSSVCDSILEMNPRVGWIMEPVFLNSEVGALISYPNTSGIKVASFATGSGTLKDLMTGTTRTGFNSSMTTAYVEPFGGLLARASTLRPLVNPPAGASVSVSVNYSDANGLANTFTTTETTTNAGLQRPTIYPSALGRQFQVTLAETGLASMQVNNIVADALLAEVTL